MNFGLYVFSEPYFSWLCRGVAMTLLITALTTALSLLLGFFVSVIRTVGYMRLRWLGIAYIIIFRNLPPVVLLLFLIFGLPGLYLSTVGSPFPGGLEFPLLIAGLSLNTSAYVAEILRSGMRAVPAGNLDAARILGLGPLSTLLSVVYPQALRVGLPALGNRMVHNMKNSTMALVLPISVDSMEVLGQAGRIAGQTFAWAEPLIVAAAIHLTLAVVMSSVLNRIARSAQSKIEVSR